jgi:hypothetical protein
VAGRVQSQPVLGPAGAPRQAGLLLPSADLLVPRFSSRDSAECPGRSERWHHHRRVGARCCGGTGGGGAPPLPDVRMSQPNELPPPETRSSSSVCSSRSSSRSLHICIPRTVQRSTEAGPTLGGGFECSCGTDDVHLRHSGQEPDSRRCGRLAICDAVFLEFVRAQKCLSSVLGAVRDCR